MPIFIWLVLQLILLLELLYLENPIDSSLKSYSFITKN